MLCQIQQGKVLATSIDDWVNGVIKEGNRFIQEFSVTYGDAKALLAEIQTQAPGLKADEEKCMVVVS